MATRQQREGRPVTQAPQVSKLPTPKTEPIVRPHKVRDGRSTRIVFVKCPYCGREHSHGWAFNDDSAPGGRVAHCGMGDYWIEAA